jgi:archaemetzincin
VAILTKDKDIKQWVSHSLLDWLLESNNLDSTTKILAICDFDAYSDELNFVFGQAHLGRRLSEFIFLDSDELHVRKSNKNNNLFEQRVIKEAVHELGHTFGKTLSN